MSTKPDSQFLIKRLLAGNKTIEQAIHYSWPSLHSVSITEILYKFNWKFWDAFFNLVSIDNYISGPFQVHMKNNTYGLVFLEIYLTFNVLRHHHHINFLC